MEMTQEILKAAQEEKTGYLTMEKLASRLNADLETVRKSIEALEAVGKIQVVSWEKLLDMGK